MYVPTGAGPLRNLDECLRAAHERLAELVQAEVDKRREAGVPLDDQTDFADLAVRLKKAEALCEAGDGAALRKTLAEAAAAVSGGLEPLKPYESDEDLAGVSVRIRAMTEAERLAFDKRLNESEDHAHRHDVKRSLVASVIDEVQGLEGDDGPVTLKAEGGKLDEEAMRVIDVADLVEPLYQAIKAFHQIPAAKKKRFGLPPPSTSGTSIAAAVLSVSESTGDATAAPRAPTDSQSQTAGVLVGTGSTTQRSESGTGSIEPRREGLGLPVSL